MGLDAQKSKRILAVGMIVAFIVANIITTQYVAHYFGYQDALYGAIYEGGSWKAYLPVWAAWWYTFGTDEVGAFFAEKAFTVFFVTMLGQIALLMLIKLMSLPKLTTNHGSAHFATMEEIKGTATVDPPGLLSGKGCVLGVLDDGQLLRDDTKTHILICAPTRSGKGVGIIIPTLLTWAESVVVTDIKGENWALTSYWRKHHMGNKILKFEPTSEFSSKYNPFDEVRLRTKYEVRDLQNIIGILIDPTGKGAEGENAHWVNNAAALLTGVVMHIMYVKKGANMYDVLNFLYGNGGELYRTRKNGGSDGMSMAAKEGPDGDDGEPVFGDFTKDEYEDVLAAIEEGGEEIPREVLRNIPMDKLPEKYRDRVEGVHGYAAGGEHDYSYNEYEDDEYEDDEPEEPISLQERMQMMVTEEVWHDTSPEGDLFEKIYGPNMAGRMHPMVKQYFQAMADKPDKEFGSILSTLDTILNTYRDPIIAENMRESDFRMTEIMNSDSPVSLYLVFPPSDIDRVKPVFRVIIEMLYRRNTESMEFDEGVQKQAKHRMLILLDEFPALGKLETFEKAMAYIAGFGMKAMIIAQDVNQIEKLYTASNSIISNCQVQVYHTPTDNKTPEFISKKLGNRTERATSVSMGQGLFSKSFSHSEMARPLMTADEVNTMDKKKELIFVAGVPPIYCNKLRYYEIPFFVNRTKFKTPTTTDDLHEKEKAEERLRQMEEKLKALDDEENFNPFAGGDISGDRKIYSAFDSAKQPPDTGDEEEHTEEEGA